MVRTGSFDFMTNSDMKQPRPGSTKYGLSYQRLGELTGKSLSARKNGTKPTAAEELAGINKTLSGKDPISKKLSKPFAIGSEWLSESGLPLYQLGRGAKAARLVANQGIITLVFYRFATEGSIVNCHRSISLSFFIMVAVHIIGMRSPRKIEDVSESFLYFGPTGSLWPE
jgi:hypothetical protein